jgi:putative polyketide hydroxylase
MPSVLETRFHTEVLEVDQDDAGVSLLIRDRTTGREERIAAHHLIAADGANGKLRAKLGIARQGPGVLQHWMSLIFDTDLPDTLEGRRFTSCFIGDLNGTFTPRQNGRWLLALQYSLERGETPEDFDAARCRELVVKGAGRSDIKAELVDARPWQVAAFIADRFRQGRSFLIGDAAHLMPPTGGFGGNTGIHDAHNLAWKLAMVVKGEAKPALLDSYDAERRPIAQATLAQALARLQSWFKDDGKRLPPPVAIVPDYDVVLGQNYRSGAVIANEPESSAFVRHQELSGEPRTRMPHMMIEHAGKLLSTHDLLGSRFLLLTADSTWAQAANGLSSALACHRFGPGGDLVDPKGLWPARFGIHGDGAVLVRPDGFIAWRSAEGLRNPGQVLAGVLRRPAIGLSP